MVDFHFPVHTPYNRSRKLPVALLHFIAGLLLLNGWYESKAGHYPQWVAIAFLLLAVFEIIYTFFSIRLQAIYPHLGGIIRLVIAIAFIGYACMLFLDGQNLLAVFMGLIAAAFVMIYFVEKRWNKPFILLVNEAGVWFPKIFKSQLFSWDQFNFVILRGNLLTLDFINNRVIQLVLNKTFDNRQTEIFNAFCSTQVKKAVSNFSANRTLK